MGKENENFQSFEEKDLTKLVGLCNNSKKTKVGIWKIYLRKL